MGCAGSKTTDEQNRTTTNKKNKKLSSKDKLNSSSLDNSLNTSGNSTKLTDDDIIIDRNFSNLINLHLKDIQEYMCNRVKCDLNNTNEINDDLINEITSKAIQLIKNSKCKTYTQLKDTLNQQKKTSTSSELNSKVSEAIVNNIKQCLNLINDNKLNKDFNLSQILLQELNKTSQKTNGHVLIIDENNNQQQQPNQGNELVDLNEHKTRILNYHDAQKIQRTLFYSNRERTNLHASKTLDRHYIVTKISNDNNNKEILLTPAEIDDILNPKAQMQNNLKLTTNESTTVNNDDLIINNNNTDINTSIENLNDNQETSINSEIIIASSNHNPNTEDGSIDQTLKQSLLDDRFYNNDEFKEAIPINPVDTIIENDNSNNNNNDNNLNEIKQSQVLVDNSSSLNDELIDKAAIKIQSTYRGFRTRKQLKYNNFNKNDDLNDFQFEQEFLYVSATNDDNKKEEKVDKDTAATLIQATFRGYQTRKELSAKNKTETPQQQ